MKRTTLLLALIGALLFGLMAETARAALSSPSEMCAYYQSRWEQGLMKVIQTPPPKCIVRVGDDNSGIGYIEGYYDGGKFCMRSYGAYFTNAGLKESTECVPAGGAGNGPPSAGNPFTDLLKDPNLKWYTAAAVVIAVLSLLSGRIINRRTKQRPGA